MIVPTVGLVVGYLYDIDQISATAAALGLNHRFSLILNAYAWDECGKNFDQAICFDLLELILQWGGYDSLSIKMKKKHSFTVLSVHELAEHYARLPVESSELFESAKVSLGGAVRCFIETEFWDQIGGPMPYSDSYAVAFYFSAYDRAHLQKMIVRRCVELDVPISELRQGCISPQFARRSLIRRRLAKWL